MTETSTSATRTNGKAKTSRSKAAVPAPRGKLVIVESPAKARTIGKYLGRGYTVKASMGHVRDLPKSTLGVDVEHDFTPNVSRAAGQVETRQGAQEKRPRREESSWRPTPTARAKRSPGT